MKFISRREKIRFFSIFYMLLFLVLLVSKRSWADSDLSKSKENPKNREVLSQAAPSTSSLKPRKGSWEFSSAASVVISKITLGNNSSSVTTLAIPLRLGYFLSEKIEVEPEVLYSHLFQKNSSSTEASFMMNFVYNLRLFSPLTFFILGGNGLIVSSANIENIRESHKDLAFNGGSGLRLFVSKTAALRIEYRIIYHAHKL
ncbi:MAG: outer membrane beta-barrel protein, partial [Candidatus Hodarchaeales archaeon]